MRSNSSAMYSDLKDSVSMSSLHSSESLGSVVTLLQPQTFTDSIHYQARSPTSTDQLSSITDLDETIKSSNPVQKLHMATEVVERFDDGVLDDGTTSQTEEDENNSVVLSDSDDEDEIEHFDSNDSIIVVDDHLRQHSNDYFIQTNLDNSNNTSTEGQTISLGKILRLFQKIIHSNCFFSDVDEEVYDNVKSNHSSIENDTNTRRNFSDA